MSESRLQSEQEPNLKRFPGSVLASCLLAFWISASNRLFRGAGERAGHRSLASVSHAAGNPGHSHNDYLQPHPLDDALANRFTSVEADIWLHRGTLQVSHHGWFWAGPLRRLYLDPLQRRVSALGSVYGDGRPFILWLDIKDDGLEMVPAIHALLSGYPMLARFSDQAVLPAPVTVVLTGSPAIKEAYVQSYPIRYAVRDSNIYEPGDPRAARHRWLWYSLYWPGYFS